MVVLVKTTSVRVSLIQIMQVRVQNKGKSVWKSRYDGDVSLFCPSPPEEQDDAFRSDPAGWLRMNTMTTLFLHYDPAMYRALAIRMRE